MVVIRKGDLRHVVIVQLPAEDRNGNPPLLISLPSPKNASQKMTSGLDLPSGRASIIINIIYLYYNAELSAMSLNTPYVCVCCVFLMDLLYIIL